MTTTINNNGLLIPRLLPSSRSRSTSTTSTSSNLSFLFSTGNVTSGIRLISSSRSRSGSSIILSNKNNMNRLTATTPHCIIEPTNYKGHITSQDEVKDFTCKDEDKDFTCQGEIVKHFTCQDEDFESEESMLDLYERWMRFFGIFRDVEEKNRRLKVFAEMARFIHNFNKEGHPCRMGFNDYTDWTKEERRRIRNLKVLSEEEIAAFRRDKSRSSSS